MNVLENIKDENVKIILKDLLDRIEKLERPGIIHFAKVREDAIVPTKRREDAGYDLYAHIPCKEEDTPYSTNKVDILYLVA